MTAMLPINPMDGGRVLKCVCFSMGSWLGLASMAAGMVLIAVLGYMTHMALFGLLFVIAALEFAAEWYGERRASKRLQEAEHLRDGGRALVACLEEMRRALLVMGKANGAEAEEAIDRVTKDKDLLITQFQLERLERIIEREKKNISSRQPMRGADIALSIGIYLVVGVMFVMLVNGVAHMPAAVLGAELLD